MEDASGKTPLPFRSNSSRKAPRIIVETTYPYRNKRYLHLIPTLGITGNLSLHPDDAKRTRWKDVGLDTVALTLFSPLTAEGTKANENFSHRPGNSCLKKQLNYFFVKGFELL